MVDVGRYNTMEVTARTRSGYRLGTGDAAVLLPSAQATPTLAVGDRLRVFVYTDSDGMRMASTRKPLASVGEFACLRCVQVSEHGAFLDWGMPKDLFVPFAEQHTRMVAGQDYVVAVCLDQRVERAMASSKLAPFFDYDLRELQVGDQLPLLVFGHSPHGAQVVVDQQFAGMIYADDIHGALPVGSELRGFVAGLRPDNRVDISLRRPGTGSTGAGRDAAQEVILRALRVGDGFLPLNDRSPPDLIRERLGLSKQAFKRALGGLYRARKVTLEDDGVRLAP